VRLKFIAESDHGRCDRIRSKNHFLIGEPLRNTGVNVLLESAWLTVRQEVTGTDPDAVVTDIEGADSRCEIEPTGPAEDGRAIHTVPHADTAARERHSHTPLVP
jgi:hypothetical protein